MKIGSIRLFCHYSRVLSGVFDHVYVTPALPTLRVLRAHLNDIRSVTIIFKVLENYSFHTDVSRLR